MNIQLFDYELRQAGLQIIGVSSAPSSDFIDCRIDWIDGHTMEHIEHLIIIQLMG